jgi:hypothetical protein
VDTGRSSTPSDAGDRAVVLAREIRASGIAVTLNVHEHKRLGCGTEFAALAEQLRAAGTEESTIAGELVVPVR